MVSSYVDTKFLLFLAHATMFGFHSLHAPTQALWAW